MIKRIRIFEKWNGNNLFFCNGKIIKGPGHIFPLLVMIYLIGYFIIFSYIIISKYKIITFTYIIYVLSSAFYLISIVFFIKVTYSNSGILPKSVLTNNYKVNHIFNTEIYKNNRNIFIKGRAFKAKYCMICHILRPPGASHCSKCNNCIEKYDHHCPFIGNCIGKGNYLTYIIFIFSYFIYLILKNIVLLSISIRINEYEIDNNTIYYLIPLWILLVMKSSFLLYLIYSHIKFIINNTSTYIESKMDFIIILYSNPFDKGSLLKNLRELFIRRKERIVFNEEVKQIGVGVGVVDEESKVDIKDKSNSNINVLIVDNDNEKVIGEYLIIKENHSRNENLKQTTSKV